MASIPLAIQTPPPISPMQNIGQLMQVRDAMSQIALRNAQTQAAQQQAEDVQAQAQQRARDLQSQNHIQELMADPNVQAEIGSGNYSTILKSATPTVADAVIKNLQAMQTTAQTLAKGKADFYSSGRAMLGAGIQGLDPTDDTRAAQQYNDFLGVLGKEHPELAQQLKPLQPGPDFRQKISSLAASNGVARSILENQAALEKEQAATAASNASASSSTATAAKTAAETPGAVAVSSRETMATDLMRKAIAASAAGQNPIDTALPVATDKQAHDSYVTAYQAALSTGDPKAASAIVEAAARHAATISMADNPQVRQGEVKKAVAVESATAPIRTAQQVSAQRQMYGGNAAVSEVAPHLIPIAIADANKVGQDYSQAAGDAKRIQDFVAAAQSGNKAAPGLIPITELRQLVNRVNPQELNAVSNSAGNAFDKVQGFFNKWTEGQPIPPEVLKDTATIANTLAQAAKRTANYKLQTVNHNYGSKFQLPEIGGESTPPDTSGGYQKNHIYGGLEYLGGDPNVQASWRKAR